jgi:histidine triad (HIT) family protein
MTDCAYCQVIAKKHKVLFEDEHSYAMLVTKPAAPGHIVLLTKEHYPIMEQVPDFVMSHLFIVANKVGAAAFEGIKAEGTNIIIQNGTGAGQTHPHFLMHLLPRRQNDGIDFTWKPQQLADDVMAAIEEKVRGETGVVGSFETAKEAPIEIKEVSLTDSEQYLLDQLHRLP